MNLGASIWDARQLCSRTGRISRNLGSYLDMKSPPTALSVLLTSAVITSCASNAGVSNLDEAMASGGEQVESQDLIGDTGVTFVATDGS